MARIHILCDSPKTLSGFSRVGKYLYQGLQKLGHECFMTGFQTTYETEFHDSIETMPINVQYLDDVSKYIMNVQKCQANLCLCIFNADDAQLNEYAKSIKPTLWYVPVEGRNISDLMVRDLRCVEESGRIIAQCNWGHHEMMSCGISSKVIYHGFDERIFRKLDREEKVSKIHRNETVTLMRYTEGKWTPNFVTISNLRDEFEGKFVFGFVGANHGIRKRIERLITSYSIFLKENEKRKKDTILLLKTMPMSVTGINLIKVCSKLEISSNVVFLFGDDNRLSDEAINVIYNCFDVNVSTSSSEGFGFSTLESMAAGVPQIGPECSSFIELIGGIEGNGLLSRDGTWQMIPDGSYRYLVNEHDFCKQMETMYTDEDLRKQCSENTIKFSQSYTWNKVIKEWDSLIKTVEP